MKISQNFVALSEYKKFIKHNNIDFWPKLSIPPMETWQPILPWSLVEMNHAGDIFEGTEQDIREFMDSKGYALVDTIKIDDIFLKKELMKKWDLSKMAVPIKFSFSENTTKIWRNRPQGFDVTT